MAQMQQSMDIARPLEEVFAFVANSANDALWGSNLVEVKGLTRPGGGGLRVPLQGSLRWPGVRAGA